VGEPLADAAHPRPVRPRPPLHLGVQPVGHDREVPLVGLDPEREQDVQQARVGRPRDHPGIGIRREMDDPLVHRQLPPRHATPRRDRSRAVADLLRGRARGVHVIDEASPVRQRLLPRHEGAAAVVSGARTPVPGVVLHVRGDFTATVDGREVALGGPRQKAVLARLPAGGGETVSAQPTVGGVWGERSAESTVASVHAYVSRLRRVLGADAIPRRAGRYVIDRDAVTVDADQFVDDVARGREALARGADGAAAAILGAALGRWRGPGAFGAMREIHFLAPLATKWEELRVLAAEALADAHARAGRAGEDVVLLQELAEQDPLRESVAVRLVRALYAAGRQADALAAYERCRHALAEQLGV